VVLRQSLADILGINVDELGYTVKPTKLLNCDYAVATIVLYDKSSGGSGFASSAQYYFQDLFSKARKYLECSCQSVCQNCLLGFDTRFHIDYLDRPLALSFLNEKFMLSCQLLSELKLLGDNSRYCSESFFTEIRQLAGKGATDLHLFLHGATLEWEILSSLKEHLYEWNSLYKNVVLVICESKTNYLPDVIKEDLWFLCRFGIKIASAKLNRKPFDSIAGQIIWENKKVKTFACSKKETCIPTLNWMNDADNVLISSENYSVISVGNYINEELLKPSISNGDVEIEILDQCNGSLDGFAQRFWDIVTTQHSILKNHIDSKDVLDSIHYSDRYLYSPLGIMLVAELVSGLKKMLHSNWSHPKINIDSVPKFSKESQRRGLFADWLNDTVRLDIFEKYFELVGEKCVTKLSTELEHGRFMRLHWQSGKITTIRFDQGVTYWKFSNRTPYFDNLAVFSEQAENMRLIVPELSIENSNKTVTQIFVKER
jgi:hypothetical protein